MIDQLLDDESIPSRRVLFVDDDALLRRSVPRTLEGLGIAVETAASAEQALEMLEAEKFPVVVADYRMPGINGIQLLERVRHMWPETVCVLITGQADFDVAVQAINRVGLFRFMVKPCSEEDFQTAFRRACEQSELVGENKHLTRLLEVKNEELLKVNRHLDREVQTRTGELLWGLLNALDLRDTETQGHSRRVALYARRLANELGIDPDQVLDVERGALLHDIGKIGVSDTILLKPGKLTEQEWAEMRRHTLYGFEILKGIEFLGSARLVVRSHHERYDGAGYPDQLAAEAIHIGARVFAVIDAYDAITSDRPYRKALPASKAREEIVRGRGTQFDPGCVEAFLRIPQADLDACRARVAEEDPPPAERSSR